MGTIRFGSIIFQVWSHDHLPRHVHGRYAEVVVIIEIGPNGAKRSNRRDAVTPHNAKTSDVRRIVKAAKLYAAELNRMWEETHGD